MGWTVWNAIPIVVYNISYQSGFSLFITGNVSLLLLCLVVFLFLLLQPIGFISAVYLSLFGDSVNNFPKFNR